MKLNILIAIAVGMITYGATLYFNHNNAPNIASVSRNAETINDSTSHVKSLIGRAAPNFTFTSISGKTHNLKDLRGKIIILNFWASWCPPCVKEFPALLELAAKHKDEAVLIALSSDIDEPSMTKFLDRLTAQGHDFTQDNILIGLDADNRITRNLYQAYRLPETYIIDRSGITREKIVGADWDIDDVSQKLSSF